MAFKKLGLLLPRQLRQAGIERDVKAARVLTVCNDVLDEIFGQGTASTAARAAVFKCRQLKIATTDASLKNEILFRQKDLISAVNKRLGEETVQRIQVVI